MKKKSIQVFSKKEEDLVDILAGIGMRRTVARVLVYLLYMEKTTLQAIEHCTALSQPEVSMALKHLVGRGWITVGAEQHRGQGRPKKIISLALPAREILMMIGDEKKTEIDGRISVIRKVGNVIT